MPAAMLAAIEEEMNVPDDLRYSEEHEWVRRDGERVVVGITDYAQDALGDIVYVGLPGVGTAAIRGAMVCEIESTKSVSEIYAPITGEVVAVNDALTEDPASLNADPYGAGWIFVLGPADATEIDALLDATSYRSLTEG
jgi:glycine cleavage system H protein